MAAVTLSISGLSAKRAVSPATGMSTTSSPPETARIATRSIAAPLVVVMSAHAGCRHPQRRGGTADALPEELHELLRHPRPRIAPRGEARGGARRRGQRRAGAAVAQHRPRERRGGAAPPQRPPPPPPPPRPGP